MHPISNVRFRKLKNTSALFVDVNAEVAQPGRALDSLLFGSGGEAEDRVVAGSNPALGTTMDFFFPKSARMLDIGVFHNARSM